MCHLHKSLYGLKQAPRAWCSRSSNFLLSSSFVQSKNDTSLFIFHNSSILLYVLIYVDGIIVIGNSDAHLNQLIHKLGQEFSLKDLGHLHYFLGVEVVQTNDGIILSQQQYLKILLHRADMASCSSFSTPISKTEKLTKHAGELFHDPTFFRQIVGSLQYLSISSRGGSSLSLLGQWDQI